MEVFAHYARLYSNCIALWPGGWSGKSFLNKETAINPWTQLPVTVLLVAK